MHLCLADFCWQSGYEQVYARVVFLAGIPIDDRHILGLAGRLRGAGLADTAERLENAYGRETRVLALSMVDREAILRCVEDGPAEFAELRAILVQEHEWRHREGL
jgi:hypothetical protein